MRTPAAPLTHVFAVTPHPALVRVRRCRARSGKHEDNHRPKMNLGVVIKHNANQRYSTTAATAAVLRAIADRAGVVLQVHAQASARASRVRKAQKLTGLARPALASPGYRTLWSGTTRPAAAPSAPFCRAAWACARSVRAGTQRRSLVDTVPMLIAVIPLAPRGMRVLQMWAARSCRCTRSARPAAATTPRTRSTCLRYGQGLLRVPLDPIGSPSSCFPRLFGPSQAFFRHFAEVDGRMVVD